MASRGNRCNVRGGAAFHGPMHREPAARNVNRKKKNKVCVSGAGALSRPLRPLGVALNVASTLIELQFSYKKLRGIFVSCVVCASRDYGSTRMDDFILIDLTLI